MNNNNSSSSSSRKSFLRQSNSSLIAMPYKNPHYRPEYLAYEDVDISFQYLELSDRQLGR